MKALVLIDKIKNIENSKWIISSYHTSRIIWVLQYLGWELYHNDPLLDLDQYNIKYINNINSCDIVVLTHCTNANLVSTVENLNKPIIFEDADIHNPTINRVKDYKNILFSTGATDSYLPSELKKSFLKLPFIYRPELQKPYVEPSSYECDILLIGNNYWKSRWNGIKKSKIYEKYRLMIVGEYWEECQKENLPNITFYRFRDYRQETIYAKYSLIDLRKIYWKYDFLTPKVVEALYQNHFPLLPFIPTVANIFQVISLFTYHSPESLRMLVDNLEDTDEFDKLSVLGHFKTCASNYNINKISSQVREEFKL